MREDFKNKTIVFFGDSITENGGFCYNIRSYLREKGEKAYIFNRGVGGTRAIMARYMMEEEVYPLNPDIVFVSYGINDMGVWLYDSFKDETPELLEKRRLRDEEHFESMIAVFKQLKERGIKPIYLSAFAADELLTEKEAIKTVADNEEKEDFIDDSFYKRKTFERINKGLAYYLKRLTEICKEMDVEIVDMFTPTLKLCREEEGIFTEDGIHYTKKGHYYLAKEILKFMGFEEDIKEFKTYPDMDEARKTEKILRDVMGYRRPTMLPESVWPKTTHENVLNGLKKNLGNKEYWAWEKVPVVLEYYEKYQELQRKEKELLTSF